MLTVKSEARSGEGEKTQSPNRTMSTTKVIDQVDTPVSISQADSACNWFQGRKSQAHLNVLSGLDFRYQGESMQI